jgi:molecular chaperone GrpE
LAADFANYKRRNEAERAEIADWAKRELALALLPILDDFGLMIEYEMQHPERLAEGAKLIRQKMMELLSKQGLERIEALNQPYDYERHEAVLSQPVQEQALDHLVLSVVQDGCMFKDKVLRPSRVIVGQYAAPEKDADSSRADQSEENSLEPN